MECNDTLQKDFEFYKIMRLLDFLKNEKSVCYGKIEGKNTIEGLIKFASDKKIIIVLSKDYYKEEIVYNDEIQKCTYRDLSKEEVDKIVGDLEKRLEEL